MTSYIDRSALLDHLRKERDNYFREHFAQDPATGTWEASNAKEEYLCDLDERIEFIEKFPGAVAAPDASISAEELTEEIFVQIKLMGGVIGGAKTLARKLLEKYEIAERPASQASQLSKAPSSPTVPAFCEPCLNQKGPTQ